MALMSNRVASSEPKTPDCDMLADVYVRVLSLPSADQRRERIAKNLSHSSIATWAFFDAVTADRLTVRYDELAAYDRTGSVLSTGELSCAASHIQILNDFLTTDMGHVIVMEDDVRIDPLVDIQNYLNVMRRCDVHYLKLYARFLVPTRFVALIGRTVFYRASWPPLGTQCYVLSRHGAQTLLNYFSANGIDAPIDQMMDRYWETGLPIVLAYPFPITELAEESTIHGNRQARKERSAELRVARGPRPTMPQKLKAKLARRLADLRLRQFDKSLGNALQQIRGRFIPSF